MDNDRLCVTAIIVSVVFVFGILIIPDVIEMFYNIKVILDKVGG
jgi:hypothetical protein